LGEVYENNIDTALNQSFSLGWLMAAELIHHGVDISFAPVLDLDFGRSGVIGDRAFAEKPKQVLELSEAFISGMESAGMSATAKHFPGHGHVIADSHLELPTDSRSFETLEKNDLIPFKQLISANKLAAIMPAHVVYTDIDADFTAGFSKHWLQDILRKDMGFQGLIYSDDLSMEGAAASGRPSVRAQKAKDAGCNVLLICNKRDAAQEIVDTVRNKQWPLIDLQDMRAKPLLDDNLYESPDWFENLTICSSLFN
jgi:beta-N-acetylhexosaminidase